MLPDQVTMCHLTGFKQSCHKLVTSGKCRRWTRLSGEHPQTGQMVDEYACADSHMLFMLLALGKQQAETTASVDKLHNAGDRRAEEATQANTQLVNVMATLGAEIARAANIAERPQLPPAHPNQLPLRLIDVSPSTISGGRAS